MTVPYPKPKSKAKAKAKAQKPEHAGAWIAAGVLLTVLCTGIGAAISSQSVYGPHDLPILAAVFTFDLVFVGGLVYLLPSIIAFQRRLQRRRSLLVTNIFLGITVIGWVGCLFWSLTA